MDPQHDLTSHDNCFANIGLGEKSVAFTLYSDKERPHSTSLWVAGPISTRVCSFQRLAVRSSQVEKSCCHWAH